MNKRFFALILALVLPMVFVLSAAAAGEDGQAAPLAAGAGGFAP